MKGDHFPKVDYKKTFIWNVPPKAVKGAMTQNTDGTYDYFGDFVTADAPGGKPADKLDDEDKKQLLKRFKEEKEKVDAFHQSLLQKEKEKKALKSEIGRRCFSATLLPVDLVVRVPASVTAGTEVAFSASASTVIVQPDPVETFRWDLGNGKKARGQTVKATYAKPGEYTLRLLAVDRYGAIGTLAKKITVKARPTALATPPAAMAGLKPVEAAVGDGTGTEAGNFIAPIAGPESDLSGTVQGEQPGPTTYYVGTVDAQGKKRFFQGVTDQAGHYAFKLAAGVVVASLFRKFDKRGEPDGGATCRVTNEPVHLGDTRELITTPPTGPAIIEGNSAYERGGMSQGILQLQTRGTGPDAKLLIDGKDSGSDTVAASDRSMIAKLHDDLGLGPHRFSVRSGGNESNSFGSIVSSLTFEPLGPLKQGSIQTVNLHVDGPRPQDAAVVIFSVSGAAQLLDGGETASVPLVNGVASVKIRGTRPGALQVRARLEVSSPDFRT